MAKYTRWKNIMKAYPYEEKRLSSYMIPYICQPKYNGFRCRAIKIDGSNEWMLLSSEENIFHYLPHINSALKTLTEKGALEGITELDGELYTHGMALEDIASIVTTDSLHKEYNKIQYYIFDVVNSKIQYERLMDIYKIAMYTNVNCIKISEYFVALDSDKISEIFNTLISKGYEGIIVRNGSSLYERKRSTNLMKFKPKKHDCYKIVGYTEECTIDGIPKSSLGSLILSSGDEANNTFMCGSGFTKENRKILWDNRKLLIGRYAYIGYQHTSKKGFPLSSVFCNIVDNEIGD